jgi:D-alanine-D-alanine ligase-like ATP-grasp enzyme
MKNHILSGRVVLLVHAGNEGKKFILQKMKELGLYIVCLNRNHPAWAEEYVDNWIIADLNDSAQCLEQIKIFQKTHPKIKLEGAVTFWEEAVLLTSKITDRFNWIGIPYAIAKKAKNKFLFRKFCNENSIPAPQFKFFSGNKDIQAIEKHLQYPLVIKPVYGAVSFFVLKVSNRKETEEAYEYIKANINSNWLAQEWENFDLLIEEYIDGDEVDIDIILQNGKIKFYAISDNFNKDRGKFFVDNGQAIPSGLPKKDREALINLAEEALEKLGIQNGVIHFEAKVAKDGVYPIEINLRMGGDYIYSYLKGAWGVDFVEQALKIALGEYIKIEKPSEPFKYIVGKDIFPESSGILVEFNIDPELYKQTYLEEVRFFKEIGDTILMPPEGYDSFGWITVSGDNLLDAQDNLRNALHYITYKTVKLSARESTMGKTARRNPFSAAVVKDTLVQAAKIEKVRRIGITEQRKLHIGIIGNSITSEGKHGEAAAIQKELDKRGYKTTFFDLNFLFGAFNHLSYDPVDIIFNACEEVNGVTQLQPQATAFLEALQIPYTGSSSLTLALCRDRIKTKKFFSYHSIPTPRWDYAYLPGHTISGDLSYPLIVKPGAQNTWPTLPDKIVKNKLQLTKQVAYLIEEMQQSVLVEEYVAGNEYEVIILGNTSQDVKVLPLICYTTQENSKIDKTIAHCPPHRMDPKLESLITEIALDSYQIMRCRDYGSVRVRIDQEGNPYVINVEAHPALTPSAAIARAAKAMKLNFGDLLEEIIRSAVERYKRYPTHF